ncbi:HDOD domain-containing protein [Massilia sp. W12]|uniref:HDOD domain-containing protein n=1 Tax=Massilia sp. W12 TaxID=3126507 RepID=UPI0030D4C4D0
MHTPSFTFPENYGAKSMVRDAMVEKFKTNADLLALGGAVSRVVELASSDDEDTHSLAYYVMSDVALTQKLLRVSNTVCYRTKSSAPVTTISRAIFLLGYDTVKSSALAMLLVDKLANQKQATLVKKELLASLYASLVGRELARRSNYQGPEEASIAALFKNLGPMLVASHEPALYLEIRDLVERGKPSTQASSQMLGVSYEALGEAVLMEWGIPEAIIQAQSALPGNPPYKAPKSRSEWLRIVAAFSAEAGKLIPRMGEPQAENACDALLEKYGAALGLDLEKLSQLFATVSDEITTLAESLNLLSAANAANLARPKPQSMGGAPSVDLEMGVDEGSSLPAVLQEATLNSPSEHSEARHPSGKPLNARDLLLAGVQDVTQMRASGRYRVNELILLALETLYRSMGFRFAVVCLKDMKTNMYRSRLALGEDHLSRQAGFNFPIAPTRDLFHLAMENDADLMIADSTVAKVRDLLPIWHRALLPDARSFIVLPLSMQKVQLGLFYADRTKTAPEGVPPDETALIKALKAQVLAALSAR